MVSCSFVHCLAPRLYWSISRTNCSYNSTRVDLYSHQILFVPSPWWSNMCFHVPPPDILTVVADWAQQASHVRWPLWLHGLVCLWQERRLPATLRPRQNGRNFSDIFKWIFLNENVWILIEISLKFVRRGPINNTPALVPIMAWHRLGVNPSSEPMMVSLLTHICVTRPQWVYPLMFCRWCYAGLFSGVSVLSQRVSHRAVLLRTLRWDMESGPWRMS